MPSNVVVPGVHASGEVRVHRVPTYDFREQVQRMVRRRHPDPAVPHNVREKWEPLTDYTPNDLLFEWGTILASLLLRKGLTFGIGGMYVEYENVASPGDAVAAPAFTRGADEGVEYYDGLAGSADRDYLRVPLVAGSLDSSDPVSFPKGNRASFFAQTSGVSGVHGKPFSDAVNSTCFGGALVAFVDEADPTRDLVLSRFYLDPAQQQVKLATSQVGYEWRVKFK